MSTIRVFNLKNKHSDCIGNELYIGRGSVLGNPYTHLPLQRTQAQVQVSSRVEAVKQYEKWLKEKIEQKDEKIIEQLNDIIERLKIGNVNLMCYCSPLLCHGDVIAKIVKQKIKQGGKF